MKKSFTSKLALLKRANDLCSIDQQKHNELYELLENFVISNEINNDDNLAAINSREDDELVTISSNKVSNKVSKRTNRTKPAYEKR